MKHSPIHYQCQIQLVKVIALPKEWACQDHFNETLQASFKLGYGLGLTWINLDPHYIEITTVAGWVGLALC